jgi:SAM-dependent methyltransferase
MSDFRPGSLLAQIAPSLKEVQTNFWVSGYIDAVSYPTEAHGALANVEQDSFWFRHRNRIIAKVVHRFSATKPVFEIGGGNGYVSLGLERAGIRAFVVEPGIDGATTALERGLTVVNAAFTADLFNKESLPAVGVFDVIEHIEHDRSFLIDCCTALEPGGFLYVTVPAHRFLWSADDEYAGHYRRYSRKALNTLLQESGFEVKQVSAFFSLLVPPLFLLRTLPSKIGRRKVRSVEQAVSHHADGAISRFVEKILHFERYLIASDMPLPFGTSLIAVARKNER